MKVLVGVKRVVDYAVKIRIKPDKTGVALENVKMSLDPFGEIALEQAIRIKEAKQAEEIIAVSVGPKQSQETIRTAIAMGADRGIHITTDMRTDQEVTPLMIAKALKSVVEEESPDLVLLGKQAIDDDSNCVGQMLSQMLDWPQATSAYSVDIGDGAVTVEREVDGGLQKVSAPLPAVITADLRLCTDIRYATLPKIMKAKKARLDTKTLEETGIDVSAKGLEVVSVADPPVRSAGITVESVDDLVDKLKNEAGVL